MDNPARLMMFPDPNSGGMGMALVPWCPYTNEQQFTIAPMHIITTIEEEEIADELVREYREKFGSGLVTPPEKKFQSDIIL